MVATGTARSGHQGYGCIVSARLFNTGHTKLLPLDSTSISVEQLLMLTFVTRSFSAPCIFRSPTWKYPVGQAWIVAYTQAPRTAGRVCLQPLWLLRWEATLRWRMCHNRWGCWVHKIPHISLALSLFGVMAGVYKKLNGAL